MDQKPRNLIGKEVVDVLEDASPNYFTVTFRDGSYASIRKDGFLLFPRGPEKRKVSLPRYTRG